MTPRRLLSLVTLAMLAGCARPSFHFPATAGELRGLSAATTQTASRPDVPHVTGFRHGPERLAFEIDTPGGLYAARVKYRAGSDKAFVLAVDASRYTGHMRASADEFTWTAPMRVLLPAGRTTLLLGGGWGFYDIEALELVPAEVPPPPRLVRGYAPSNPHATPEARALLARLAADYGRVTWSGVYSADDDAFVRTAAGVSPLVRGGDLMDYSPSRLERGSDPKHEVERLIDAHRAGHVVTVSWHWNAPKDLLDRVDRDEAGKEINKRWYKGFYTNATTFDVERALADESSEDYRLLLRDIDAIAVQLRKFDDARVPVLWRPLHEAEGRWFWWGAKGPEPLVKLWRLMHDRLTHHHKLHNLLWVYTAGPDPRWYPGDDVVDLVGIDAYPDDPADPLAGSWDDMVRQYAGRKLIALTEIGGTPDIARKRAHGVYWSYWTSWTGDLGPKKTDPAYLPRLYTDPHVRNR